MAPGQELGRRAVALEEAYGLGHGLGHKVLKPVWNHPTPPPVPQSARRNPQVLLLRASARWIWASVASRGPWRSRYRRILIALGTRRNHPTPSRTRPTWPRED